MPFNRPTLPQLRDRIANDIEFRVVDHNGVAADAHTPGTGYTELAHVIAAVAHGLYANQQWLADQILVQRCDDDVLVQKAAERGLNRIQPVFATGTLNATGTTGVTVPAGAVYQTSAGVQYRVTANTVVAGGTAALPVIAMQPGAAGNVATGAQLTAVNTIAGIDSTVTVAAPGITGGADIETIERLRDRVLENLRQPPMGGNNYDYVAWAKAASVDVTRAWVFSHDGAIGAVAIRIVCEDLANPIATAPVIASVQLHIDDKRPSGLRSCTVGTFTAVPLNLVFTSLSPNTPAVHAAIEAEVKDLIRREYTPGGTIPLSHVREAISRAAGENDYVITLATNLTYTNTQYPTWGVPTWPA